MIFKIRVNNNHTPLQVECLNVERCKSVCMDLFWGNLRIRIVEVVSMYEEIEKSFTLTQEKDLR